MTDHWWRALELAAVWSILVCLFDVLRTRRPVRQYVRDVRQLALTALAGILFGLVVEFGWDTLRLPVLPVTLAAALGTVAIIIAMARVKNRQTRATE